MEELLEDNMVLVADSEEPYLRHAPASSVGHDRLCVSEPLENISEVSVPIEDNPDSSSSVAIGNNVLI